MCTHTQTNWFSAVGVIFGVLHSALENANQSLLPGKFFPRGTRTNFP
jgi:hypothetical protein